jgi:hypothetical protein
MYISFGTLFLFFVCWQAGVALDELLEEWEADRAARRLQRQRWSANADKWS